MREFCPKHPDAPLGIDHLRDAVFCLVCKVWVSKKCGDSECSFCASRPEFPEI